MRYRACRAVGVVNTSVLNGWLSVKVDQNTLLKCRENGRRSLCAFYKTPQSLTKISFYVMCIKNKHLHITHSAVHSIRLLCINFG